VLLTFLDGIACNAGNFFAYPGTCTMATQLRAIFALILSAAVIATPVMAAEPHADVDYRHQKSWKGVLDHAQSPIDIVTRTALPADRKDAGALLIASRPSAGVVEDNGHAVQVNTDEAEAIIRGRHFRLTQFHFHSPSEHTLDGKAAPLEGHFVFRAQDGRLAVVGVMFQEGADNPDIEPVLAQLRRPGHFGQTEIDIARLLPADKSYYHYLGSLTTPPLTENVEWYVLAQPVALGAEQLKELHDRHPHNNRQQQAMNDRPLVYYPD
jgi:carbonic anhydrase